MLLRSRWVLPITAPPIEDGAVFIKSGTIQWVGPWTNRPTVFQDSLIDLGNAILSPGFVNAHCHLEYTHFAGQLSKPKDFVSWIDSILALKSQSTPQSGVAAWHQGYRQLLETGTTLVADMVSVPEVWSLRRSGLPKPLGPRIRSFFEATGVLLGLSPESLLESLAQRLQENRPDSANAPTNAIEAWPEFGVAPHSPYATLPTFLKALAQRARRDQWPLSMHLAESAAEFQRYTQGAGPLYDWLKRLRPMEEFAHQSPVQYVAALGLLIPQLLAAHVNYLAPGDAETLGNAQVNVVHCPRSHAYFNHQAFPIEALTQAGVSVCLGTDSLASIEGEGIEPPRLSMQAELQCFLSRNPSISPAKALKWATLHGAQAMGCPSGELRAGLWADLIITPLPSPNVDPIEAVIHHQGPVSGTIIRGEWIRVDEPPSPPRQSTNQCPEDSSSVR